MPPKRSDRGAAAVGMAPALQSTFQDRALSAGTGEGSTAVASGRTAGFAPCGWARSLCRRVFLLEPLGGQLRGVLVEVKGRPGPARRRERGSSEVSPGHCHSGLGVGRRLVPCWRCIGSALVVRCYSFGIVLGARYHYWCGIGALLVPLQCQCSTPSTGVVPVYPCSTSGIQVEHKWSVKGGGRWSLCPASKGRQVDAPR